MDKLDNEIWVYHFSDSHGYHERETENIPKGTDLLICSGDVTNSNYLDPLRNLAEFEKFVKWWNGVDVEYKVFVPGNHDSAVESGIANGTLKEMQGHVLIHQFANILGYNIFGSPYCPIYGRWPYMINDGQRERLFSQIPNDTDILVTHCPPKGTRDIVWRWGVNAEHCGRPYLTDRVFDILPLLHCFGHLHDGWNTKGTNNGVTSDYGITFSNGSIMIDGNWGKEFNSGNLIKLPKR